LTADALQALGQHEWPGNVRELQNLMERAAVLCGSQEIDASFFRVLLPQRRAETAAESAGENLELEPALEELERKMILRALAAAVNNKSQAARLLGISERTLWYKLKRYGL
jgi:two-component system response regulator AtoC